MPPLRHDLDRLTKSDWQELLGQHSSVSSMAREFRCTRDAIKARLQLHGLPWSSANQPRIDKAKSTILAAIPGYKPDPTLFDWLRSSARRRELWQMIEFPCKVLVLSDLHIPFQNTSVLEIALKMHKEADYCVINGDFVNFQGLSSFLEAPKGSLREEFRLANSIIDDIEHLFKLTMIDLGNHEDRFRKMFLQTMSAEKLELLREVLGEDFDQILNFLAGQRRKVKNAYGYLVRIGDAYIGHPDEFSSVAGRSVTNVADYLDLWQEKGNPRIDGWADSPFRTVVTGHTHHLCNLLYHGYQCIESGALCYPIDYAVGRKLGPGKKERWYYGCAHLEFDKNGRCDWNGSGYTYLGE